MVHHLYKEEWGRYENGDNCSRMIARESVVHGSSPKWVVGTPRNFGRARVVTMVTKVDPSWLTEVAPQLVNTEEGLNPNFDSEKDSCVSTTITHFNGQQVKEERVATPEHKKAADVFCDWLANQMV